MKVEEKFRVISYIFAMENLKNFIIYEAKKLGFDKIGFAKAEKIDPKQEVFFKNWIENNHHASMSWMKNHFEKRINPTKLVENAKTVVVFATNYYSAQKNPLFSIYAQGTDYHDVMKKRFKNFFKVLKENYPEINGRAFTDTAPLFERYFAEKAGIGWQGKNTMLITREFGSYVFLSAMLLDIEITPDSPHENFCGKCTKCLSSCPTDAFVSPFHLDSNNCISYLTIEHRGEFSEEQKHKIHNSVFGCDICQEVCPWNKFAKETQEKKFVPRKEILELTKEKIEQLTEEEFLKIFQKNPVKRTKFDGLKRNLKETK
jgi:epoxyqueuosine reductase